MQNSTPTQTFASPSCKERAIKFNLKAEVFNSRTLEKISSTPILCSRSRLVLESLNEADDEYLRDVRQQLLATTPNALVAFTVTAIPKEIHQIGNPMLTQSFTERDAARYNKLRVIADLGRSLSVHDIKGGAGFDAMVDAVNLEDLKLFNTMNDFAELVLVMLHDVVDGHGFKYAAGNGGTGIFRGGFSWRNVHGIEKEKLRECREVVKHVLTYPEYAPILKLIERVWVEREHEEDACVRLDFKPSTMQRFGELPELMSRLMYGDLSIMEKPLESKTAIL